MSSGNVHKVHSDDIDVALDTPVDGVRGELDSAESPSASTITGPEAALFSTSAPAVDPLPVHSDMVERSGLRNLPLGKRDLCLTLRHAEALAEKATRHRLNAVHRLSELQPQW